MFMEDSIVRKTDRALSKGDNVVVCFPEAQIEAITQRVVHVGTNNAKREGTTAIGKKYRQLVRKAKQTHVEQIIMSGILLVMGSRGQGYRNCRRMTINTLVQQLCSEEEVDFDTRDGLHLSGKGAGVFAD